MQRIKGHKIYKNLLVPNNTKKQTTLKNISSTIIEANQGTNTLFLNFTIKEKEAFPIQIVFQINNIIDGGNSSGKEFLLVLAEEMVESDNLAFASLNELLDLGN